MEVIHKIGRRKTAVARVYVAKGKGNITVNKKDMAVYFPTATLQYKVNQPLTMTNNDGNFDITVNVYGGGITGHSNPGQRLTGNGKPLQSGPLSHKPVVAIARICTHRQPVRKRPRMPQRKSQSRRFQIRHPQHHRTAGILNRKHALGF